MLLELGLQQVHARRRRIRPRGVLLSPRCSRGAAVGNSCRHKPWRRRLRNTGTAREGSVAGRRQPDKHRGGLGDERRVHIVVLVLRAHHGLGVQEMLLVRGSRWHLRWRRRSVRWHARRRVWRGDIVACPNEVMVVMEVVVLLLVNARVVVFSRATGSVQRCVRWRRVSRRCRAGGPARGTASKLDLQSPVVDFQAVQTAHAIRGLRLAFEHDKTVRVTDVGRRLVVVEESRALDAPVRRSKLPRAVLCVVERQRRDVDVALRRHAFVG